MEEWRPIKGFEHYEVSNLGRVRSLPRFVEYGGNGRRYRNGRRCHLMGKILTPSMGSHGYLMVSLTGQIKVCIHALICAAFHGEPPTADHEVAHSDGSKINNSAENLRWVTRKENMADAIRHGRTNKKRPQREIMDVV